MKRKLLIYTVITLTLIFLSASVVLAECPEGKVAATIANPAGKVIEICVPANAVEHIGGPNDIVIPATCPCFSQEDVEQSLTADPSIVCRRLEGTAGKTNLPCSYVFCYDATSIVFDTVEMPDDADSCHVCDSEANPEWCMIARENTCSNLPILDYEITEKEGDACAAILKTFVP